MIAANHKAQLAWRTTWEGRRSGRWCRRRGRGGRWLTRGRRGRWLWRRLGDHDAIPGGKG